MRPASVGKFGIDEGHRIVKTCNLTYFNAGTSGGLRHARSWTVARTVCYEFSDGGPTRIDDIRIFISAPDSCARPSAPAFDRLRSCNELDRMMTRVRTPVYGNGWAAGVPRARCSDGFRQAGVGIPDRYWSDHHRASLVLVETERAATAAAPRGQLCGPITDEGVAVGGAFDSDTAVGMMPIAHSRRQPLTWRS